MLASPVAVSTADVAAVEALYDRELYSQAYRRALEVGPLETWSGTAALLIAGRLAGNIGAPRLARRLHQRAWREDRASAGAAYFRLYGLMQERGPRAAWDFLERLPAFPHATPSELADLELARCSMLTLFRDFDEAERHLDRAREIHDHRQPWRWVLRSELLKARDRYPEALAAAEEGMRLQPWYRGAVTSAAELLPLLGRDAEAVALLQEALQHTECAAFASMLASLQAELGDDAGALKSWQLTADLSPLMEKEVSAWWHGRMSDAHYACGDLPAAAEAAAKAGTPFFTKLHARLTASDGAPAETGRVLLPVPFVRQLHMTCAPATLSALSTFLGAPIDHLSLARLICYDGTPDHEERQWLQQNGWTVREFRVTWEAALALLDRGLPFTMVTMETQSAHLQAVIGYDRARGTMLIRDPFQRTNGEGFGELVLEHYAASGPRGMVLVPNAEAVRLDGMALPEAAEYDRYFQVRRALHEHRRTDAERVLGELHGGSPGHRLTLEAERVLAAYDADHERGLRALETLLERFPKAGHLQYAKLALLRELGRAPEAEAYLRELAQGEEPAFWREWGQHLAKDAREQGRAARWLARSVRVQGLDASNLAALGDLRWQGRRFAEATQLYRHAACLRDKVDGFAQAYLMAARHLRQAERVLELLTQRFEENAARSVQPTRVLFWALSVLDRHPEAFAKLEQALTLRPEDGELLLLAADAFGRFGDFDRAATLLAQAKPRCAGAAWLRAAATLADYRCDLGEALALWSEVLAAEPLAMDAQNFVTRLTAETAGREAALANLAAQVARFPHHLGLRRLAVEGARASGAPALQEAVEALLAISPHDAWARRELALTFASQRRLPEAREQLARAEELEARLPLNFTLRAYLARIAGDLPAAREAARQALRLSVDHAQGMHELLAASETFTERRESIAFIREELIRQVVLGDGLLTYRSLAFPVLEPAELLAGLREALAARPDLWHAWSATVQQLTAMGQLDEALTMATEATERFPLLVPLWLNLARVYIARGEPAEQIRPLRRALVLQPACGEASRALSTAHERGDALDDAQRVLEVAIAAAPLDSANHSHLAGLLDKRGRTEAAVEAVERALRLEPGLEPAWELLRYLSNRPGFEGRAVQCARSLTELRPAEPQSWMRLAECLPVAELPARLEALDRALALNPRFMEAYDARALLLAGARRWEEACAACAPDAWPAEQIPVGLRGRRVWIDAERGDLKGAVLAMRALLEREPDFVWGWYRLVEWESQLDNFPGALEATEQLCRLAPQNPIPLGWRASLLLRANRGEEAIPVLRRAMELDPSYPFASRNLFDQHLAAKRLDEAAEVLARMKLHLPGAPTLASEVRLQVARREFVEVLEGMRRLCFMRQDEAEAIAEAGRALVLAGQRQGLEKRLAGWVLEEGISPAAGKLLGELVAERGGRHAYRALGSLDLSKPVGKEAYLAYLRRIGQHRKLDELRRLLRAKGPAFSTDTELWGQAGSALVELGQNKEAIAWFRHWERRPELPPWILLNIAIVLRRLGRLPESVAAGRRALSERPDHTTPLHQLWMASDALLAQRFDEAEALAGPAQFVRDGAFYDALREVVNAGLAVHRAAGPDRGVELSMGIQRLNQPPTNQYLQAGLLQPVGRQTLKLMAQLSGTRFKSSWIRKVSSAQPMSAANIMRLVFFGFIVLSALARSCSEPASSPPRYEPRASEYRRGGDPRSSDPLSFATPTYRFQTPLPRPRYLPTPATRATPGPASSFSISPPSPLELRPPQPPEGIELRSENRLLPLPASPRR